MEQKVYLEVFLEEIKQKNSLNNFKESIKLWALISCPCRLCKVFFLDFIDFFQ